MHLMYFISVSIAVVVAVGVSAQDDLDDDSLVFSADQKKSLQWLLNVDPESVLADEAKANFMVDCFLDDTRLYGPECQADERVYNFSVLLPLLTDDFCRSCGRLERAKATRLGKMLKERYVRQFYLLIDKYNGGIEPAEIIALVPGTRPKGF